MNKDEIKQEFQEWADSVHINSREFAEYIIYCQRLVAEAAQAGANWKEIMQWYVSAIKLKASILGTKEADEVDAKSWDLFWRLFTAGTLSMIEKI